MKSELGFEIEETAVEEKTGGGREKGDRVVSGAELAEWLCCTQAAITQAKKAGNLIVNEDGKYPLKANIGKYISSLRARKNPKGDSVDLERSLQFWKVENEKQKNLQWRLRYGQEIAQAILGQLGNGIAALRHTLAGDAEAAKALKDFAEAIATVDTDAVVYATEDEENYEPGTDTE
ncbi:MAG: hypothetical protein IJS08_12085 [Victivallales bacterium]|nr:hypothetical protein [Victivallales bacterium]